MMNDPFTFAFEELETPGVTGAEEPCHCSRCSAGRVPGGNTLFYGFENKNLGDGADLWPEEQLDAMALAPLLARKPGDRTQGMDEKQACGPPLRYE